MRLCYHTESNPLINQIAFQFTDFEFYKASQAF